MRPEKSHRVSKRFPEALTIHPRNVSKFIVFGTSSLPESPRTSEAQIRGLLAELLAEATVVFSAGCFTSQTLWK